MYFFLHQQKSQNETALPFLTQSLNRRHLLESHKTVLYASDEGKVVPRAIHYHESIFSQTRVVPQSVIPRKEAREKRDAWKGAGNACEWCCTGTNGLTKLGLTLSIIALLILIALAVVIPVIFILRNNQGHFT